MQSFLVGQCGEFFATIGNLRMKRHHTYPKHTFLVLGNYANGLVIVAIHLKALLVIPRGVRHQDWRAVLEPVVARYQGGNFRHYFRADAAFANPEVYEYLEAEGFEYAIRLPANDALLRDIEPLLTRPVGRPSNTPVVWYAGFLYQAKSWSCARRVVAKVEWHSGELFPRIGFIVTNLKRPPKAVVRFYNQRGTAEQWIKEGKNAVKWTRLSCHDFVDNQVRLQLFVLAYNLGNFLRQAVLPGSVRHWTLTTLREKLIKIGAKVVRHSRKVVFQMAEVAVPRELFRSILQAIERLRLPAGASA